MLGTLLGPLYRVVAWTINAIHSGLTVFTDASWTWGVSIILLTVLMRILLFPLFMKQFRSQREMQLLQPKIAALKTQYPGDRTKQSEMQMALFKEHGVNPFSGCLPLLVQLPVFFALFGVLHKFTVGKNGLSKATYGLSAATVHDIATSKIFGVPLAAAFSSSKVTLGRLHVAQSTVKTVTLIMIAIMIVTALLTSMQMMRRTKDMAAAPPAGGEGAQKSMLYGIPLIFGVFGINFQMGVLLYWVTTNFWTYGQQGLVLKRMGDDPEALIAGGPGLPGEATVIDHDEDPPE